MRDVSTTYTDDNFDKLVDEAIKKMGKKNSKIYINLRTKFQQEGCHDSLRTAQALLTNQPNLSIGDKERLLGYLDGNGKIILPEPEVLLTEHAKMPGLDGNKMSKSYNNTIQLRENAEDVEKKILTMPTDPARVKRTDPGEPERCPLWQLHKVYSDDAIQCWASEGCRTAGIGCVDCKRPVIDAINKELKPIQESISDYENDLGSVKKIVADGSEQARIEAQKTLDDIREAMELDY